MDSSRKIQTKMTIREQCERFCETSNLFSPNEHFDSRFSDKNLWFFKTKNKKKVKQGKKKKKRSLQFFYNLWHLPWWSATHFSYFFSLYFFSIFINGISIVYIWWKFKQIAMVVSGFMVSFVQLLQFLFMVQSTIF